MKPHNEQRSFIYFHTKYLICAQNLNFSYGYHGNQIEHVKTVLFSCFFLSIFYPVLTSCYTFAYLEKYTYGSVCVNKLTSLLVLEVGLKTKRLPKINNSLMHVPISNHSYIKSR